MFRHNDWHLERFECRSWDPPQGNGVYLFIRFPGTSAEYVAQTVVLARRSAVTARGQFVGIARKILDLSTGPRHSEALVVYLFESTEAARRFFVSDNRFKQPDFPPPSGLCEAWTVVKYLNVSGDREYRTYMMCETNLKYASYNDYRQHFVLPFAGLVLQYGGQPFVVQSIGVESLRRHHPAHDTIVTVHLFRSERDIKDMMEDPRYADLKRLQSKMADDSTSVFTIDPQACP